MFLRMLRGALLRQRSRRLMIIATVALGASVATSMLSVMFSVGDKINQELKAYGANIVVRPQNAAVVQDIYDVGGGDTQQSYLDEADLPKIKTIFWTYNIVDFAPLLTTSADAATTSGTAEGVTVVGTWFTRHLDLADGESVDTGLVNMRGWWTIDGSWPAQDADDQVVVGVTFAQDNGLGIGDSVTLTRGGVAEQMTVSGIVTTGAEEDNQVLTNIGAAQELIATPGAVGEVEVSALTTPDNDLARKAAKNPASLSVAERETWYCTAYVSSIAYQIEEVIPDSTARAVRQVSESEGTILEKTQLLMVLVTILSMAGAALAIANLVTANVMERAAQIGLMKAIGARDAAVVGLILTEILIIGLVGGLLGFGAGIGLAQLIGHLVFGSAMSILPSVAGIVAALVLLVVLAGSIPAIRFLLRLRPAEVLHGR
ncbi:ABC transporter permease [Propionibacterium australiense]|uniref:FtsX-like permease family n=1 Tax=Propionibacterium australiense TaxID=119981 RepID=A0A383S3M9_9ACTN|nr:ABC transporter permease [Propionibacterium australiense]RLP11923.1 FtsX-like permease family protein [Propionibacterium australiense]RLP12561.1 FtsX-like permease family protein [Propionibacterium australiense]SYZ32615.1 FtsX-like permease family [Propionibacterium australiense]VEH91634.1 Macrolide export ATP-binding/permease protein MacB [Propionibacterium australiense]